MNTPSAIEEEKDKGGDLVRRSSLYQEFLAEREEILRHKWIESEKAGHDIGFEKALLDWVRKYRDSWRMQRRAWTRSPIPPTKSA